MESPPTVESGRWIRSRFRWRATVPSRHWGRPEFPERRAGRSALPQRGFTLVELMVASVIFLILLGVIFTITSNTGKLWKSTNAKISTFQNARAAFDAMTRNLSQATLNHGYDYYDSSWKRRESPLQDFTPANYGRWSDLHYLSGPASSILGAGAGDVYTHAAFFQAPLGRVEDVVKYADSASLMNAVGYQVEFADAGKYEPRPKFIGDPKKPRMRYQLLQTIQPSEGLAIYDATSQKGDARAWIKKALAAQHTRVLAENIIALVILPMANQGDTSLAPNYLYDSAPTTYDPDRSHLLPPLLQVTLVAIDEDSAIRLQEKHGNTPPPLVPTDAFTSAANYDSDLQRVKDKLDSGEGGLRINYRIFTATIQTKEGR